MGKGGDAGGLHWENWGVRTQVVGGKERKTKKN